MTLLPVKAAMVKLRVMSPALTMLDAAIVFSAVICREGGEVVTMT